MGQKKRSESAELTVENLMIASPTCCTPDTSLHQAAALLWDGDIGALPVVDGSGTEQLCGIITDRDIAMAAYTQGRSLHELRVSTAFSAPAHSCRPSDDAFHALELMANARIRRLVVVNRDNRPVGVVSLSDIARMASRPGDRHKKLERAICRTLAAITSPADEGNPPDAVPHPLV